MYNNIYLANDYFEPVMGLSFQDNEIFIASKTYVNIPFSFKSGKATECKTGNALPDGLDFDFNINVIKGRVSSTSLRRELEISCSNTNSETNKFYLTIIVSDKYQKGIIGSYLKSDSFDNYCFTKYTPSSRGIKTEIVRRDTSLKHNYNPEISVWDGLTNDFANDYAVYWNGLLKISESGTYTFKMSSSGAAWLMIDGSNLISHSGCHDYASNTRTLALEEGYATIEIIYVNHNYGSGFELLWGEDENDLRDISQDLYYVYENDLDYNYRTSTYIIGDQIPTNEPIYMDDSISPSSFSIDPSLPSGLNMGSNGIISGTPESSSALDVLKSYVVSANIDNNDKISTTIFIKLTEFITPSGIYFVDYSTFDEVDTTNMVLGEYYQLLIQNRNGKVADFGCVHLPSGWTYDDSKNVISGLVTQENHMDRFGVRGYYGSGSILENLYIGVKNVCGEGNHRVILMLNGTNTLFSLNIYLNYTSASEYYDYITDYQSNIKTYYTRTWCLPYSRLNVRVGVSSSNKMNVKAFVDGVAVYSVNYVNDYNSYKDISFKLLLEEPVWKYPYSDLLFYVGENDTVEIETEDYIEYCHIAPSLPAGLTLNPSNGRISGSPLEPKSGSSYSVTCSNAAGAHTENINIAVSSQTYSEFCESQGKVVLRIIMWAYTAKYMKYTLYSPDGTVLKDIDGYTLEDKTEYNYRFCLNQGRYSGVAQATSSSGWSYGYVTIYIYSTPLGRYSLRNGESSLTSSLYVYYTLDTYYQWSYSNSYQENWNSPTVSDSWQKQKVDSLPEATGRSFYVRTILENQDVSNYTAFFIRFSVMSGAILKINEKEVLRVNLPSGEVNPDTQASQTFNSLTQYRVLLPISYLEGERINIGIELHRGSEIKFPQLRVLSIKLEGDNDEDCTAVNLYIDKIESFSGQTSSFPVPYGFDMVFNTDWDDTFTSNGNSTWAVVALPERTYVSLNQFSIRPWSLTSNHPKTSSFSAYINNQWVELGKYNDIEYGSTRFSTRINTTELITKLRVDVTENNGDYSYVRDFGFHLCPERYCESTDLIPRTLNGLNVVVDCKTPVEGNKRVILCQNNRNPHFREMSNNCTETPTLLWSYNGDYVFKAGRAYSDLELFTVSGNSVTYQLVNAIPGLKVDEKTGLISGIPYVEMSVMAVRITARNNWGNIDVVLRFGVEKTLEPALAETNGTMSLIAGNEYNGLACFIVIGENVEIMAYDLPSGMKFDPNLAQFNGIPRVVGTIVSNFVAKNQYGQISFTFTFEIESPLIPKKVVAEERVDLYYKEDYESIHPFVCVGNDLKYSTDPALFESLSINEQTGAISGKVDKDVSIEAITFKCENVNGSETASISFNISIPNYPILVDSKTELLLEAGVEQYNISMATIVGNNIRYISNPTLPTLLTLDEATGLISGYAIDEATKDSYRIMASGGGKTVSYSFALTVTEPEYPVIIKSSIISRFSSPIGKPLVGKKLFYAVGKDIRYSVSPSFPGNVTLNAITGGLHGTAVEIREATNYTFTVSNNKGVETVSIIIDFSEVFCEEDKGFPRTSATVEGVRISIDCAIGMTGKKYRTCMINDLGNAKWGVIVDDCVISTGTIAGASVAAIVIASASIVACVYCCIKRSTSRNRAGHEETKRNKGLLEDDDD